MKKFLRYIACFSIITGIGLAALLICIAVMMLKAPELFFKIIYYGIIVACLVAAACILFQLLKAVIKAFLSNEDQAYNNTDLH